jgi:hypothetical protein
MKKFQNFKLSKFQQRMILGGKVADVTIDCVGGGSITCSGTSCTGSDSTKTCKCTTASGGTDEKGCVNT